MKVNVGDWVLLYIDERRSYLVKVVEGKDVHTDEGVIALDDIVGLDYGSKVKTHLGVEVAVTRPLFKDIVYRGFKRRTQIIYLKDAAYIALTAGIGPGSIVVEAGTGTGALTAVLAHLVRPEGRVYTYEVRREFLEVAKRNIKRAGLSDVVVFRLRDIKKGIEEKEVDAVILDMPDPWLVSETAYDALRNGGAIVCFIPTVNQLEKTALALKEAGFIRVNAVELLERHYKVTPGEVRPLSVMVGHTGYILSAQKP